MFQYAQPTILLLLCAAQTAAENDGERPLPPRPPVERHPSNDDWGSTFVAIAIMSLIVFAALGILVKKSFELVPTGMMNLRTLVGGRQSLRHHQLADDDQDGSDSEDNSQGDAARRERVRGASEASNEDATVDVGDIDREEASAEGDARALHIIREPSPHTF